MKNQHPDDGFTVAELLIATTVFAIVLTGMVYALLFVSDNFLRGEIQTQTQEVISTTEQQIGQQVQLAGTVVSQTPGTYSISPVGTNSFTYSYICVGDTRYSYSIENEQTSTTGPVFYWQYSPNCSSDSAAPTTTKNVLLPNDYTLADFSITYQPNNGLTLYALNLELANGQQVQVDKTQGQGKYVYSCSSSAISGYFCSVYSLNTLVGQVVSD